MVATPIPLTRANPKPGKASIEIRLLAIRDGCDGSVAHSCLRFRSARHLRLAAAAYSVGALALIEQLWKPREHEG